MDKIPKLGIDLAKSAFQPHGVDAEGRVVWHRPLRRSPMLEFFQRHAGAEPSVMVPAFLHVLIFSFLETSRRQIVASVTGRFSGGSSQVSLRRRGEAGDDWRWKIVQRKTPKQAAIALANRLARTASALMKNRTGFQAAQAV